MGGRSFADVLPASVSLFLLILQPHNGHQHHAAARFSFTYTKCGIHTPLPLHHITPFFLLTRFCGPFLGPFVEEDTRRSTRYGVIVRSFSAFSWGLLSLSFARTPSLLASSRFLSLFSSFHTALSRLSSPTPSSAFSSCHAQPCRMTGCIPRQNPSLL